MAKFDPIKNAVILDTETIGIGLGSPMHEVALYDIHTRSAYQFLMQPNFTVKLGYTPGVDSKMMSTRGSDYLASFFDIGFDSIDQPVVEETKAAFTPNDAERLKLLKQFEDQDETIKKVVQGLEQGTTYMEAAEKGEVGKIFKFLQRQGRKAGLTPKDLNIFKLGFLTKEAKNAASAVEKAKNVTTLKQAFRNAGMEISWGDTIVAKAIYKAEMEAVEKLIQPGMHSEEINKTLNSRRVQVLQQLEEMINAGGIGKVLTDETMPADKRQAVLRKVARGDSFFYEKVMKPLGYRMDGTRDTAKAASKNLKEVFLAYPYLSKIFDQSIENMTLQQKMSSPLVSNLESLAVAENVSMYELITGQKITVQEMARATGEVVSKQVSFSEIMRGKAIWIANANFESKMFGSHAMALEAQFTEEGAYSKSLYSKYRAGEMSKLEFIKSIEEGVKTGKMSDIRNVVVGGTSPYTADMFTISNPKIAEAKAKAQVGFKNFTYRSVFRAYRDYMRGGDVGDILDIVKAHQSYLIGMGKTSTEVKKPITLSIDVAYRLYRAAEVGASLAADETNLFKQDKIIKALFEAETHRALEDTTVEHYVLGKAYGFSDFYENNLVLKKNVKALYDHTVRGSIAKEAKLFHYLYNRVAPEVQKMQFEKRILSAIEDINTKGYSVQTTGVRKMGYMQRLVPQFDDAGNFVDFTIEKIKTSYLDQTKGKVRLETIDDVAQHILGDLSEGGKGIDANYQPILSSLREAPDAAGRTDAELMRRYVEGVFDRMKNAGLVKAGSDVRVGEIRGMGGFDSDAIGRYQRRLGHETDNIMARVIGLTDEELEAVKGQREILTQQAMGIVPEPEPKPVIPEKPPVTQAQYEEAVENHRVFQSLFGDMAGPPPEPPPPPPPPRPPQPDEVAVNRVIKDGLLNMFSDITDLRYDQVLKEAGRVDFSQEDSIRGIAKTIAFDEIAGSRLGMKVMAGMAAVGAAGAILSNFSDGEAAQRKGIYSLRTMNYQKWLETQKSFYGMSDERNNEGMSHSGINSIMRKFNSDFGSPYQGPAYSFTVFEQQGLLRERENYLRERFGRVHYTHEGSIGRIFDKIRLGSIMNRVSNSAILRDNYDLGSGTPVSNVSLSGINRDANLVKLNLENYRIEVSDADTITLRSKGPNNALTGFFGMNSAPISIRLAGIDAPETAHADRAAQPFAQEAKGALQAMLNGSKNISIYVDRGNVTYGRQVGHVMVDDKNASLELLRRGYVSYLPFKGKGQQQSYDMKVFNSASKLSQGNDYGMWGNPYFQAYRDIVKSSGNTITFNTLVNTGKVAENANLMNVYSLMNTAGQMGMYNSTMAMEAAAIGADISEKGLRQDYKSPVYFGTKTAPHKSYMLEMLNDMNRMMETKGAKISNKLKVKEVAKLNKSMAIDSTGVSTSIYNKRRTHAEKLYGAERNRRYRRRQVMAMAQKNAHRQMQAGPIGHHRM